jgi:hypothetical protein
MNISSESDSFRRRKPASDIPAVGSFEAVAA